MWIRMEKRIVVGSWWGRALAKMGFIAPFFKHVKLYPPYFFVN